MTYGGEEKYTCIQSFVWDLKKRCRLKHHSIGGRIILKWGFKNEMSWLGLDLNDRIATKGGLLCVRLLTLRFRNMRVVYFGLGEELLPSE